VVRAEREAVDSSSSARSRPADPVISGTGPTGPIRTCIGCRRRDRPAAMLRMVAGAGNEVVPDPDGRLPGRGAWMHPDSGCLDAAERRRAFGRALRTAQLDTTRIRVFLAVVPELPGQTRPAPCGSGDRPGKQVDPT
jgi:uncharacterized protein